MGPALSKMSHPELSEMAHFFERKALDYRSAMNFAFSQIEKRLTCA
jgi:hypothetical protein